ncbi:MAG: glutaminyl-peptide cyclotransferase [Sediminicola sp.]|tara:strand:- start:75538 stop:76578 length:1041 start_codon:yes stop_codon:yes gene_type:complete
MKGILYVLPCTLALLHVSCGGGNSASKLFELQLEGDRTEFQQGSDLGISISNPKQKTIDNISYKLDGDPVDVQNGKINLDVVRLGNKTLSAMVKFDDDSVTISKKIKVLASTAPELYTYEILNEYPHDIKAYTQGLEFHGDTLYEGTGRKGQSSLRKVDYRTGEVLKKVDLANNYFGEGITILNNKIYQLTWQSGIGFIYDLENFEKLDSFNYGNSKEGWGLCNDGNKLLKSDGSEKIYFLDPVTLVEEGHIECVTDRSIFNKTNELEYVDGKIYANVYQKESMMIIDAQTGAIIGVINFGGLKSKVAQHSDLDVLNGVAYHAGRKTFFVTGKNWDKLFEVTIVKK